MIENTFDPQHPHEPEIPPHFDADGRCLICVMICKRDRAIRERDEAIKQIHEEARDYELQIKKLCEAYNDLGEQNAKLKMEIEDTERAFIATENSWEKLIKENAKLREIAEKAITAVVLWAGSRTNSASKLRAELDQLK